MEAKQWAVRGPGMPQKILKSDKPIREAEVKKLYLKTVKYLESNVHRNDNEVPWRIEPLSDDDVVKAGLSWCFKETRRRNHRAIIQVESGKIVEDVKPVVPVKRTRTRVDVQASQPAK